MLRIMDRKTGSLRTFSINDAHHHIGEDVDGNENVPVGTNGSYELSKKLEDEVIEILKDSDSRYWIPDKNFQWRDYEKHPYGLIDQFVVFPMKDKFKDEGEITYSRSNKNISQWINSEDHTDRLLGFGRADPSDIESARKMIKRFPSEYGLIGLKIHPDSERFELDSNRVIQLFVDCARMNLPIIFHTGYVSDVDKIHNGVNKTISLLVENKMEDLIGQLNVIAGHFSYDDEDAFRYLSHPCIYGELSTLTSPENFIRSAKEKISLSYFTNETLDEFKDCVQKKLRGDFWNIFDVSTNWSNKLMLGTDHPFLPRDNIIDLFECLFCSNLSEELQPSMIHNILGKNLIDILPVNAHLTPSYRAEETGETLEKSRYEKRRAQLEYYMNIISKDGLGTGPVERKKKVAALSIENGDHSEGLKTITEGLKLAKRGYTLAKMICEEKHQIDESPEDEVLKEGLETAQKGQYSKGIEIIKKGK
ncbi:MAG: amidohydrolase family protein [Candidatus Natronoplasma sp.]